MFFCKHRFVFWLIRWWRFRSQLTSEIGQIVKVETAKWCHTSVLLRTIIFICHISVVIKGYKVNIWDRARKNSNKQSWIDWKNNFITEYYKIIWNIRNITRLKNIFQENMMRSKQTSKPIVPELKIRVVTDFL